MAGELPDLFAETEARRRLEERWLALTNRELPAAARPGWPVRLNHCFQRILLDHATGGVWYDAIAGRPAYLHASDAVLRRAIETGEAVLAGTADLDTLNARSLAWRGKRRRA
ncbi:GCN5-related N-acetyltransferase [Jannaschia marina]|uniref:GCN5-related N-acetyltransferase n=1 Tax=Jannaschia marina TaxID=2741674 RepID=UPI0015C8B247|nr:GCN5-related N-acetyltransferase [Jannaschia marina]